METEGKNRKDRIINPKNRDVKPSAGSETGCRTDVGPPSGLSFLQRRQTTARTTRDTKTASAMTTSSQVKSMLDLRTTGEGQWVHSRKH